MTEPAGSSMRPWLTVALILTAAWVFYLVYFGPAGPMNGELPAPAMEAPNPPRKADFHWVLRDLKDAPIEFSSFEGRAVFLNIWATWCGPCVMELPAIAHLAENPRLKDVAFLCVSTDDSAETVQAFLRGKTWSMQVLRATALPESFMTDGIPATFLIAPDGRIAAADVGSAQWDDPSVVDFLEKLAGEAKPPAPAAAPVSAEVKP